MSKEGLVFPGEQLVRVKDPSALEFPEVPRVQTGGVKHDLEFPEGEEAREAAKDTEVQDASKGTEVQDASKGTEVQDATKGTEVQDATKDTEVQEKPAEDKAAQEPYVLTPAHSETETTEEPLEACEERKAPHLYPYASPRPARVFASRALTAVAAVALVGLGVAAVRPSAGRLRPVLVVPVLALSVVASVVACGARYAR